MELGNEPFMTGDEVRAGNRVGTAAYSHVIEGFHGSYYHLHVVWRDDLTTARFTDNIYRSGVETIVHNPRTRRSTRLIEYGDRNETKENTHGNIRSGPFVGSLSDAAAR